VSGARYVHTNIIAKDWRRLARFYVEVFGCAPKPPERDLSGDWLDELTSMKGARVRGIHLHLPGHGEDGPTLEIFEYARETGGGLPDINARGFAHIAFAVDDVKETLDAVESRGGGRVGELVSATVAGVGPITLVYARDPEGNIIEIQKWA
jgi:predicted enzyme related to lactoylglutathione lyase